MFKEAQKQREESDRERESKEEEFGRREREWAKRMDVERVRVQRSQAEAQVTLDSKP